MNQPPDWLALFSFFRFSFLIARMRLLKLFTPLLMCSACVLAQNSLDQASIDKLLQQAEQAPIEAAIGTGSACTFSPPAALNASMPQLGKNLRARMPLQTILGGLGRARRVRRSIRLFKTPTWMFNSRNLISGIPGPTGSAEGQSRLRTPK